MTVHSGMLAEVLSDWGLLELLLGELRRRAKILRKAGVVSSSQMSMKQHTVLISTASDVSRIVQLLRTDREGLFAKQHIITSNLGLSNTP